jgi:hypothetical protein
MIVMHKEVNSWKGALTGIQISGHGRNKPIILLNPEPIISDPRTEWAIGHVNDHKAYQELSVQTKKWNEKFDSKRRPIYKLQY